MHRRVSHWQDLTACQCAYCSTFLYISQLYFQSAIQLTSSWLIITCVTVEYTFLHAMRPEKNLDNIAQIWYVIKNDQFSFTGRNIYCLMTIYISIYQYILEWRHNGRDDVSNHQPHQCLLNRLFRRRSKKTPKLRVTGLCAEFTRDRRIPRKNGQWHGVCFHLMTSSSIAKTNTALSNKNVILRTFLTVEATYVNR